LSPAHHDFSLLQLVGALVLLGMEGGHWGMWHYYYVVHDGDCLDYSIL